MKHYKSVEELINDYWLCKITGQEALICARYFDRERANLDKALRLVLADYIRLPERQAADYDEYYKRAVKQINKAVCPLCQKLMQQTDTIQFVGNQVYHQSCWLARPKEVDPT